MNPIHYMVIFIESLQYSSKRLKKVVAISEVIAKELKHNYNLKDEDIEIIPNGVDIERFSNNQELREKYRSQYNFTPQDHVMIIVANEFKRKGLLLY